MLQDVPRKNEIILSVELDLKKIFVVCVEAQGACLGDQQGGKLCTFNLCDARLEMGSKCPGSAANVQTGVIVVQILGYAAQTVETDFPSLLVKEGHDLTFLIDL